MITLYVVLPFAINAFLGAWFAFKVLDWARGRCVWSLPHDYETVTIYETQYASLTREICRKCGR